MRGLLGFYNPKENKHTDDLRLLLPSSLPYSKLAWNFPQLKMFTPSHNPFLKSNTFSNRPCMGKENTIQQTKTSLEDVQVYLHGRIYNQELLLAQELPGYPPCLKETELIHHLYQKLGENFIEVVKGAFIIIVYDPILQNLLIFRDAVGEKIVYYTLHQDVFIFSDNLKTFFQLGLQEYECDPLSMIKYFTFSYVPDEYTMVKKIFKLLPGHYLKIHRSGIETRSYWHLLEDINESKEASSYAQELRSLVEEAVSSRIKQYPDHGVFLSGGLDSSLITALSVQQTGKCIPSFSISFGKKYPNELFYSRMVSKHCRTDHHILEVTPKHFLKHLHQIIYDLDDPIGDPITVPNYLLARYAKDYTKAILNGEGGDPAFGGPKNIPMIMGALFREEPTEYYCKSYKKLYEDLPKLINPQLKRSLNYDESLLSFVKPYFADKRFEHYLNKLMHLNIKLKGGNNILVKVEKAYQANGIIPLSPLFDKTIMEYSFQIPPQYKLNGRVEKYILKLAVEDLLPQPIIWREKSGMRVPVKYWFQGEMKRYTKQILSKKALSRHGYFNYDYIKTLLRYSQDTKSSPRYGVKLWMLLNFEIWHRIFIEGEQGF